MGVPDHEEGIVGGKAKVDGFLGGLLKAGRDTVGPGKEVETEARAGAKEGGQGKEGGQAQAWSSP